MNKTRTIQEKKTIEIPTKDMIITGNVVLYKNINKKSKLDPKFIGSYIVNKKQSCRLIFFH